MHRMLAARYGAGNTGVEMTRKDLPELTFAWLDAQIEALPEGPVAALDMPRWMRYWTLVGVMGTVVALSPSLFLRWWEPAWWMVYQARIGLAMTMCGLAPAFARSLWVIAREFRRHRHSLVEQFDHDTSSFQGLIERLSAYPPALLERQCRYAAMGHERLGGRLVMLLGGIERLGLLPLLLSLLVLLRNAEQLVALPAWQAMLGILAAILWLIGWAGAEFRRRLQLWEFLLQEALIAQKATFDASA
ncbi:hypothetical protein [Thermomonas brevis]